jgi:BirA family biotin operon repressor/biotin-[acetyl-CoA-carboxylase] ligase
LKIKLNDPQISQIFTDSKQINLCKSVKSVDHSSLRCALWFTALPMLHKNVFRLAELRERIKPFRLHWFPRVRSTNDHAAALRKRDKLFAPAIVLAGHQTAGRGRGSNSWWSGEGSLTVTFVLAADDRIEPHQLPLIAGLAVRDAAAELTGDGGIQLKWPNDILDAGKKLGGLLCERILKADLVGLGLNVNLDCAQAPRVLRDRLSSLAQIRGNATDITEALAVVASHLRLTIQRAADQPFAVLLREYDAHHALIGREISVTTSPDESPLRGRCEGLDAVGRLLVHSRGKLHHVISGQVITT